jgi:hypothetical protein
MRRRLPARLAGMRCASRRFAAASGPVSTSSLDVTLMQEPFVEKVIGIGGLFFRSRNPERVLLGGTTNVSASRLLRLATTIYPGSSRQGRPRSPLSHFRPITSATPVVRGW